MALSFLQHGITQEDRNSKRKVTPTLITWNNLPGYFENQIEDNTKKLIRETVWAKQQDSNYPLEARMMFGNANVPFGYSTTKKSQLVKSVPCSSIEQGKKQLVEFIDGLKTDIDTQKVVANFVKSKKGFDAESIPAELLAEVS